MEKLGDRTDPDGLPLPDDATLAQTPRRNHDTGPKASDWADLAARVRWAVEAPGTKGHRIALNAVIDFLNKQPGTFRRCGHAADRDSPPVLLI